MAIFRISSYKMVAYGTGAISDDSEDIDAKADPKRKSKEKIGGRPNKRKRRQKLEVHFCETNTEAAAASVAAAAAAAAERQKDLEEVKGYQEKLEERVSFLEATLLSASSRQIGVEVEAEFIKSETNHEKEMGESVKRMKKSQDNEIVNDSELEDLLLGFKPGENEEDSLEIADEDVVKLLAEDDPLP